MNKIDEVLNLTKEDVSSKTARELYKISQAIKVKNYTHYRKGELIQRVWNRIEEVKKERKVFVQPEKKSAKRIERKNEKKIERKVERKPLSSERKTTGIKRTVQSKPLEKGDQYQRGQQPNKNKEVIFKGLLEIHPDGYGFLRSNYFPSFSDIYVSPPIIRRLGLRTGDMISGPVHSPQRESEKYPSLVSVQTINGLRINGYFRRPIFEGLTPIYPDSRIKLDTPGCNIALRAIDLVSPLGKGQRGLIVSPPKAGKTTLLKEIAKSVSKNYPDIKLMILLIDERPEEVTDMKMSVPSEVISSTFDQPPENHIRVVELALERAKRLVELGKDVVILLDGITRLTRAYNLLSSNTGKTLSGGLDPSAIKGPKKFLGAARNILNGGSLTILATTLIDTGSRLDQVIYEEFKGTGNMEIVLSRELAEERIFPAVDIKRSGTRKEELLYTPEEFRKIWALRRFISDLQAKDALERLINMLKKTQSNDEFLRSIALDEK